MCCVLSKHIITMDKVIAFALSVVWSGGPGSRVTSVLSRTPLQTNLAAREECRSWSRGVDALFGIELHAGFVDAACVCPSGTVMDPLHKRCAPASTDGRSEQTALLINCTGDTTAWPVPPHLGTLTRRSTLDYCVSYNDLCGPRGVYDAATHKCVCIDANDDATYRCLTPLKRPENDVFARVLEDSHMACDVGETRAWDPDNHYAAVCLCDDGMCRDSHGHCTACTPRASTTKVHNAVVVHVALSTPWVVETMFIDHATGRAVFQAGPPNGRMRVWALVDHIPTDSLDVVAPSRLVAVCLEGGTPRGLLSHACVSDHAVLAKRAAAALSDGDSPVCGSHGFYVSPGPISDTGHCECEQGWHGPDCTLDEATCARDRCHARGRCTRVQIGCVCDPGRVGDCSEQPVCLNGGSVSVNGTCQCPSDWRGPLCEYTRCGRAGYWANDACVCHGHARVGIDGTCSAHDCGPNGRLDSTYRCKCDGGYYWHYPHGPCVRNVPKTHEPAQPLSLYSNDETPTNTGPTGPVRYSSSVSSLAWAIVVVPAVVVVTVVVFMAPCLVNYQGFFKYGSNAYNYAITAPVKG